MLEDVQQLSDDAAKLAASPVWPLSDDELTDCLQAAYRLEQAASALQARLVRQAETRGVPARHGSRGTAAWLRTVLLLDPSPARDLTERAAALGRQPAAEQALLDGHADMRQAAAIADVVDSVRSGLSELGDVSAGEVEEVTQRATTTLIEMAGRLPAYQLRRVGQRILAHVAPHLAERAEAAALARQEARAHQAREFTWSMPRDGIVRLSGRLSVEDAATVRAALEPLCAPVAGDDRRPAQRRADALVDVCRLALRSGDLPDSGGEAAQVAVTIGYDPLTQALGAATTDSGERLSGETARRMACDARILPVVLGGAGQVLDIGRTRRLATGALRRALHVRDRGCAFPDCDRPPRWTDAHHIISWASGGATSLDNLVLLCRTHHRVVHHPDTSWRIRLGADGLPEFIYLPEADAQRHPRRNLYHPRH
ncbi:HNH endonuclease [Paractinoplanes deccanensis]|uniref:HNH endonuclease n=1 Tax=Paractinoplanes deccanensis TaxID=113561 RepID=A0ABQ3XUY3_9ACTN|nr:HNH endonuclease signature motif containing protein [Actinoplanes deccanensis]GID71547.1 HNH endonuclease [Actinoplanes deccanensis]